MAETAQTIVAGLAAAFPNAKIGADHIRMYVRALADLPPAELERAALAHAVDGRFFPSIRELRRTVMEARAGLPTQDEAWEQATDWSERYVREPREIRCPNPECVGGTVPGGEPVHVDRSVLATIETPEFREALERIADAMGTATQACPTCGGDGTIANPAREELRQHPLRPAVQAALDHVGGPHGLVTSDVPEVIRAQFLKAYTRQRDSAVRRVSLESAGIGELAGAMHPELPPGQG